MKKGILLSLIISLLFLCGCAVKDSGSQGAINDAPIISEESEQGTPAPISGDLKIHFIDVGQGDSILVQLPNNKNILIDAGEKDKGKIVVNYLKSEGVSTIDYLVATHPHEDHIGGMIDVLNKFNIGKIYMPKVSYTTKTFEDFLSKIKKKGLKVNTAKADVVFYDEPELSVKILAPVKDKYDETNDYSAVIKIVYKQTSFLLMGDASNIVENEIISKDIKADLIKIGHHGSRTSTSDDFLKKVDPKYAVISCGKDNVYGHPHKETIARLQENNIAIYRTDEDGTIVATSDGADIKINYK